MVCPVAERSPKTAVAEQADIVSIHVALKPEEARKHLGYMPDLAPVASDLKVWEFLNFHADTHSRELVLKTYRKQNIHIN